MVSFYGGANAFATGGGGGVSNYNELSNKPIINLVGIQSAPVSLALLNEGLYVIRGNYIYREDDVEIKNVGQLAIEVVYDETTQTKNVIYKKIKDNDYYIVYITYNENSYEVKELNISEAGSSTQEIIDYVDEALTWNAISE